MLYKLQLLVTIITLAEFGASVMFSKIDLLNLMQGSIKQQNTFTTTAAANAEVIASHHGCYEWF